MIQNLAGLLPAILLILYINHADKLKPEPPRELWRAFLFGVASIAVSLFFTLILETVGLDNADAYQGVFRAFNMAFWGAAIPEECAKLLMLWLVVRKNPHFDERMDGIVYAVCVGMGFAGLENMVYINGAGGDWIGVGIVRALMAVPGHYYDAVFMGYFFALYWFDPQRRINNLLYALGSAILAHGIYDFLLMYMDYASEGVIILLVIALFYSCIKFFKIARQRISQHLEEDERDQNGYTRQEQSSRDGYNKSEK